MRNLFKYLSITLLLLIGCSSHDLPDLGTVPQFSFSDIDSNSFGSAQMHGKINVVSFMYTGCPVKCPLMSVKIGDLYLTFASEPDLQIVSITVDPEHDSPEVLKQYAEGLGVSDDRWRFLRAEIPKVVDLSENGLKLPAEYLPMGHSTRLVLVDDKGIIRGYYSGIEQDGAVELKRDIRILLKKPVTVNDLSHLNALLNGISAVLLMLGFRSIKRGRRDTHKWYMIAALVSSGLFLISYLTYHHYVGSVPYPHHDWTRPLYFTILIPHIILAAVQVPFIIAAVTFALKGNLIRHKRLVRWVFPVWMFVSVSGLVVYFLLYWG